MFLDKKKEYKLDSNGNIEDLNINFDNKYIAPSSQDEQRNEGVIGIGTDGKPVDMDLWEYTLLEDGSYGLNDKEIFIEDYVPSAGYNENNLVNGKIQGTIPQYIKGGQNKEFIPVTNLNYLFYNISLSESPIIPNTITSMRGTFNSCKKLNKMPEIPNSVISMYGTFASCIALTETCSIPDSVIDMTGTFNGCTSLIIPPKLSDNTITMNMTFYNCVNLINAPDIPDKVEKMNTTFLGCTNLRTVKIIPESVDSLDQTFQNCINLRGEIEINANISDISNCYIPFYGATTENGATLKLKGSCPILNEIIEIADNPNIT